ncbi:MAG: hypothetical protein ACRCSM_04175 [Sediminibacterium sp.]|nr:hypothetical protein [Chitinophagaceae bacterium]MCA6446025.1 hypothetical protein [Chitinophagaceae bacterium]
MKLTQEKALLHLTGNTSLAPLRIEALEKLVNEYPFFSPGQYLFSAKLKKEDHPLATAQAAKTALYFSNPLWLQFQLDNQEDVGIDEAPKKEFDTALLRSIHQKDKEWDELIGLPKLDETMESAEKSLTAPILPNPDIEIPTIESVKEMMRGIDPISTPNTIIPVLRERPKEIYREDFKEEPETIIPTSRFPKPGLRQAQPDSDPPPRRTESHNSEPTPFLPVFSALEAANIREEEESPAPEPESELPPAFQQRSDAKIASILSESLEAFKKPVVAEDKLEINVSPEKLHTVDYFASQGIHIDLAKIPQDKLTTKLRKFTDWLKDMKQLNPNPVDLGTSVESELAVAENAMVSNQSKEILTETMAEVLAKQGQIDKAIQLYIKLSFSNPEKTAYFAAKIQQLKGI